jgi:hypothetical protein
MIKAANTVEISEENIFDATQSEYNHDTLHRQFRFLVLIIYFSIFLIKLVSDSPVVCL